MEQITASRSLDALGRITLPLPIRKKLELNAGDKLGMYVNSNNCVVIQTKDNEEVHDSRKLDKLGRIVLNSSLRNMINLKENDTVDIFVTEKKIILRKKEHTCIFCGSDKSLKDYNERKICINCIEKISKI